MLYTKSQFVEEINLGSKEKLKIILVEDNVKDAALFTEIIQECEGFHVEIEHFTRLEEGLVALASNQYDLLVLDLTLPDSVGTHTFKAIKTKAPKLPIIVLTGTVLKRDELKSCLDMAHDYLVKGYIDHKSLSKKLSEIIKIKQLGQ